MKKKAKEYNATYHPDFLAEWQKYEKAYGSEATEKFMTWIESNGLDVEFPLQPQMEARLRIPANMVQGKQASTPVIPQKPVQGQVFGNPLFVGRIADQSSVEKNDFEGFSDYKVISKLDGKKYFENVAEGWANIELGPRPQIVGKKKR